MNEDLKIFGSRVRGKGGMCVMSIIIHGALLSCLGGSSRGVKHRPRDLPNLEQKHSFLCSFLLLCTCFLFPYLLKLLLWNREEEDSPFILSLFFRECVHLRLIWESPLGSVHTLSSHLNPYNPLFLSFLNQIRLFICQVHLRNRILDENF